LQKANAKQQELLAHDHIKDEYASIQERIEALRQQWYRKYTIDQRFHLDKVREKTSSASVSKLHEQLSKYFKDPTDETLQSGYRSAMNFHFDHYVEPKRWCSTQTVTEYILFLIPYESEEALCPTNEKIIEVITEEANLQWDQKSDGVPHDLDSFDAYQKHSRVLERLKLKVNDKLSHELNPTIDYDNLTLGNFAIQYQIKVEQEIRESVDAEMNVSFEQYTMPKNMTWEQFVKSNFVKDQLRLEFIPEYIINDALDIIISKDLNRFNAYFNRDGVEQVQLAIDDILYDLRHLVTDDERSMQYGRDSYYLIYVLPLFLIFTLLVTIINLVSVTLMLAAFGLYLFRDTIKNKSIGHLIPYGIATIDSFLISFIIFFTLTTPNRSFFDYHHYINKVYLNTDVQFHQYYFNLLSWVASFEGKSYAITDKLQHGDASD